MASLEKRNRVYADFYDKIEDIFYKIDCIKRALELLGKWITDQQELLPTSYVFASKLFTNLLREV